MSDSLLLQEGLSLMAFGMGFVFVFLTLLVAATSGMSRLVMRFAPPEAPSPSPSARAPSDDPELLAVIGAAVKRYRRHHGD
ncbi:MULTISPECIES: OadG family protein [Chromohalobacter]|uniref:OadG family protein n=1 Tax=Chromohalobacter TaxID=42054 RepID=UPI00054E52F6|nr:MULTISPECIES: OadG family protein [Chromohalobacter]MBZ5877123.1 OadG family protein [Chromohalobacter salexigens]MCT8467183.1 OadG family protein [Chromohalobacter canadensis]MCT8471069.1 OadG family protein [Chromohalobacter canadensis]MCT8497680.1 OadG family protein [Chromohalobacter canadensis]MDF9434479.1 OadG family protein [Chromohalobacter israelensis]